MEPESYGGSIAHSTISSQRYNSKKKMVNHMDDERIEVKILPQDEHWGETTTINGGNDETLTTINNETTIDFNDSFEIDKHMLSSSSSRSQSMIILNFFLYLISFLSLLSPILFLILPFVLNQIDSNDLIDYTYLLPIIFKIFFLLFGIVYFFFRRKSDNYLPRIDYQKFLVLICLLIILLTYWFYYIFKFLKIPSIKSERVFSLTSFYEDLLIYFFLINILLVHMKYFYPKWIVKIVRSPDGHTKQYTIGRMSIQEASVFLLEQYYKDFPVFNPWLENLHQNHGTLTTKSVGSQSNASTNVNRDSQRSMRGFNDR